MTTKQIEAELASICDNYKNPDLGLGSQDVDKLYKIMRQFQNAYYKAQEISVTRFCVINTLKKENEKLKLSLDTAIRTNSDRNEVENER